MWIIYSLTATFAQVTRNLFSKTLTKELPVKVITISRFLYALPVILTAYLITSRVNGGVTIINGHFYKWVALMAICQVTATYFRISLFHFKSFAVSQTIVQVETIIVAILGGLFLSEILSISDWAGILIATTGLILATLSKYRVTLKNIKESLFTKASLYAFLTGFFLASAGICAKQSFGFLHGPDTIAVSLFSLTHILIIEIIILLPINLRDHRSELKLLFTKPLKPAVIGICSGIGSSCWLIAYSLTNNAYVRTVGQLEFIIATLISIHYLKEKVYRIELAGMGMVILGTLILILIN